MIAIYESKQYSGNGLRNYRPSYKSRGEREIADYLSKKEIKFTYERPTLVIDKGFPKIWAPDFSLDEYKILIDYVGVRNDPQYHYSSFYKSKVYARNSIDYLALTPDHLQGEWKKYLSSQIEHILKDRYYSFKQSGKG